jgi:hypothetical protein
MIIVGFAIIGNNHNSYGLPVLVLLNKEMKRIYYLSIWNSRDIKLFIWEAKIKMGLIKSRLWFLLTNFFTYIL